MNLLLKSFVVTFSLLVKTALVALGSFAAVLLFVSLLIGLFVSLLS